MQIEPAANKDATDCGIVSPDVAGISQNTTIAILLPQSSSPAPAAVSSLTPGTPMMMLSPFRNRGLDVCDYEEAGTSRERGMSKSRTKDDIDSTILSARTATVDATILGENPMAMSSSLGVPLSSRSATATSSVCMRDGALSFRSASTPLLLDGFLTTARMQTTTRRGEFCILWRRR